MSIVSNVHTFVRLEKDTKALTGQRLARLIAKKNRDGVYENEHLQESLAVSVPKIADEEIAEHITALLPAIAGMLEDAQDALIREFRIEHGRNEIPQDAIDMTAIITYLEESAKGGRITKEYMQAWFIENYSEAAAQFIRHAMEQASDELVAQKTAVIRDMFAGFAGAKYSPEIPKLKAIIRFAKFVGVDAMDARMGTILTKSEKMLAEKMAAMSEDALGF